MAKQQNDLLRALKQAEPVKGAVKVDLNAIYRAQQQAKTPYLASEAAAIPSEELELKTEELLTPEFSEQIKSKTEAFREQFAEELATGAAAKYREESDAQPSEEMASVPLSELAMISGSILDMTKDVPGETNAFGYDATARLRKKERVLDELKKNYGKYGFSFDLTPMGNYVARSSSGNIEVDLYGDGAQAADKLKGFIAKNAKKTQYQNEEFVDLSLKAQETRPAARINPDGTRSTHLFTTMEVDGKHYAVPTLYQKTPNSQSSDPNDWVEYKSPDEAFKEAVRRGELYQFDTKGQAESFAKGSWKSINQGDLTRKRVAEQNGIEYGVMKQNELERKYSREEINSLEDAIDILSSNRPGLEPQKARLAAKMKKAYGVGTVDGLEKVLDEKRKQKDSIEDYFQSLSSIRQEADRQLEAERKKAEQQAIALNREAKTIQGNLNQKFNDYFGVPFLNPDGTINPEIKNVKPSDVASARAFNESIDAYNLLAQRQKQAAQVYLKERTYFDAKYDKEAQDKYVGEWQGLLNSIRSGWNEGKMSNVVLDAQAAKIAGDEEKLAIYNEQMFKMMNDPAISTAMSVGQERIAEATESGEFGDYLRALGANPSTFISGVANMTLNSMARMFPILWKTGSVIVPVSTAIGGAVGGVAGARAGFSTGMKIANAASGFSLEYTASVLESIRKKYNTLEKAQEGEWLNDPEVWKEARDIGVKRGLTIAAVDAITAGMLSKIAPSSLASTARRTTQAVGQALAIEPVSEAFGEAAAQFVSGQELNSVEILGEALGAGGMSSNPLTLADVVYQQTRKDYYTNLAEKMANSRSFLNDMDEDLGKVTQWANNMRTTGQITGVTEQQILENVSVVREARQMMSATAPTNAQRLSQLALGTSSRAESRLADLIAAKRQLDRTPTINQPMQQAVQDEMNYILQSKKVPEQRVDLAPIIGLTPKYYINGKASLREDVAALLDPAKASDEQIKDLNISIEGDEELLDKYVTRMESIFDKEDYEDGKVMLAAEDINEIPAEFRPEAVFNEETGRHEVTVPADKVENKDIANIAVRPKSQLEAATTAMKEGKPVYAKDTKSGDVYLLEDQAKIDDAYSRGMSLLLGGPSTRGVQTPLPLPKIKADKIKAIKDSLKSMKADIGTMNNFGSGMGKDVWDFAIDSAILAIEAGESVSAAVEKAADYIDSKSTEFKRSDFVAYMTGQLTSKEKEIVRRNVLGMKQKVDGSERPKVIEGKDELAVRTLVGKLAWRIGLNNVNFVSEPLENYRGKYDPTTHSVTINLSFVSKDTPFHEILAHPIIYALKSGSESSRELYDNLVKEMQNSPEGIAAYNMVSQLYPELTEDQRIEEALVTLLGQLASESFDKKSSLGMLLEKLWNFVSEYVRELLGKEVIKIGELKPTTTIQDLADIMGYGENLIALPGTEIGYRTPSGETYASIEEVKQDMARAGAAATLEFPSNPTLGSKIKKLIFRRITETNIHWIGDIDELIKEELKNVKNFRYYDSVSGRTIDFNLIENAEKPYWEATDVETGEILLGFNGREYDKNFSNPFNQDANADPRWSIIKLAQNLRDYYQAEEEYSNSKQYLESWKKEYGIKYNPQEAYDRGYGFYHYMMTGMSKNIDFSAVIQNIGRFLDLQEQNGGEYSLSCLTKLASLPINSEGKNWSSFYASGVRIALYPNPEDIIFASKGDAYTGTAGATAGKVSLSKVFSPQKTSSRVGVSLLTYPGFSSYPSVTNSVLDAMVESNLSESIETQKEMFLYNELGIKLKKGRFRIEYDESASKYINEQTKKIIDYINENYGIQDSNIPEIKPNVPFGIKEGSFVELDGGLSNYDNALIKITYVDQKNKTFSGIMMNEDGQSVYVPMKGGMIYPSVKKGQTFLTDIPFKNINPDAFINYQYSQGKKAVFPSESKSLSKYLDNNPISERELEKNQKKRLLQTAGFVEAVAQASREFPMALLETTIRFAGFQPNEDTDVRFSRVPENDQTLYGAINDARNEGLTDGEIKRRMQQEGYSSSDINEAMTINIGDKEKLPRAFTMVEGGAFAGYSMYTNVQQKIRRFAKKEVNGEKPSSAKIREFAMQELSKHPLFLSSSDYLQMSLMADLDATLNTTANTAIQAQMKRIREAMRNINKGARELNEIRRQLTILIKSSLPRTMYAKAEVMALLKKVSSANRENIAEIRREVADFVIGVRVRATRAKLLKQLAAETTKKEGGRVKGSFSTAMQERIAKIKGMFPDEKASVEEIQKTIVALNSEYTRLNELVIDEGKDEYAEDLADVEFALKFAATMLMDDIEENKLIALDELYSYMKDFLKTGRAAFKDELKAQSEYYNKLKRQLLKDITGGDYNVNFSDKKAVDKVERALMGESVQKEKQRSFGKVLRSFVDDTIGAMLRRTEDLAGLVDRISNMTGEFFGGVSKKLIVDRVRESRANLNKLNNDAMAYLQTNAEQIFGKGWKKIMIQNGKKKFTYIMDPKGYQKVLKTGDKVAMQAFLLQNEAPISQNEMYYLYNQFKDPANHPGFETKFGPQYKEIMAEITSKLDPKVKEWADWQVEEFYPNMYPIYNEVYRRVYRTDLPWNQFYAGRLYRESADGQEAPSLLEKPSEFITAVGGASTKERVRNNKAVKTMDGDKVLTSYVRDMNFFASYAESIRDIKKMLNNITIRKAIETRVGKDIYSLLNMMTDRLITDGFGKGKENDILDAGFKTFVYAKLGLNPKIMLAQASSFVGFIPFIGYGSYAKYATRVFSDLRKGKESTAYKTWAEMMENSEYLKARFSTSNIMEIMSTFSDSKRDVVLGGDKGLSIDNYANVMMYFIKQGDKAGVMGSVPNYLFYKEQYINKQKAAKKKVSEQDAIKYALKKIEAQVKSVAQSNDVEDKDFFQTGSTAWRMFGVFQSQPKQYFRLEMYAIRNIYKQLMGLSGAKGTLGQNIRLFVTVHLVAPVLFQYLMLGLPGILTDFDDDDDEELIWAGVLGNLNAIFLIGDIFQKIRDIALSKPWAKDTTSISAFSVIADLSKELWDIFHAKTDETRTEHIVNFSLLLSELSGIPASTLFKLSQNWYKVATGDVDDFGEAMLRLFNYSEYTIKGAPKKQKKAEDFTFEEDFKFEE